MNTINHQIKEKMPDILVVDDTPANLQLLTEMLKKNGYRVRPVPGGKLALQAARRERPDLILLDITMPEMDGYEVCEKLKADPALRDIPVLFISALDETMDKVKAFAVGGLDYITKPFQFEEVEARVQTHLKLRQLQLELETQNRLLQENYDKLRKLEELRDNLTHMIVHDMRSPLLGIISMLEFAQLENSGQTAAELKEDLADASTAATRLGEMVTSLLDVSRLEAGEMPLHISVCDLNAIMSKSLRLLAGLTVGREMTIQPCPGAAAVPCDPELIERVVANLLGNALKHTPHGTSISISVETADNCVKVAVRDTGPGIPPEYHQRIFEKFGQAEGGAGTPKSSTGLGLTFCKLAITAHSGKIGVESDPGKGCTFWFTLPVS